MAVQTWGEYKEKENEVVGEMRKQWLIEAKAEYGTYSAVCEKLGISYHQLRKIAYGANGIPSDFMDELVAFIDKQNKRRFSASPAAVQRALEACKRK